MAFSTEELDRKKPVYQGTYDAQMQDLYGQITNRPKFGYDAAKDPLYQNYKDQYIQNGKLAMKDTMGQAAALTGGYGSTYGQQVGQQTYDAYLKSLGEVIPELYGMAYQQYQDQGDALMKQYGMLGDLQAQEYGRYRDALGDWTAERDWQKRLETEEYNRQTAEEQRAYERQWNEDQRQYQREQDAWQRSFTESQAAYQREQDAYQRQWNEEARDYQRSQDAYTRLWNEQQREYQRQQDEYTKAWNEEAREYSRTQDELQREWNEENRDYQRQQDYYQNLYKSIASSGYIPSDAELRAAGMSKEAAYALAREYDRNVSYDDRNMAMKEWSTYNSGLGTGGGGSSGGSYGGGGYGGGGGGYYDEPAADSGFTTADIVAGKDDAIMAAAYGYKLKNTEGKTATEKQLVDAIEFATNRAKAGAYAYKPNKNARNY